MNQLEQERRGRETARLNGGKQEGVRVGKVTVLASPDRQRLHHFTQRLLAHAYQVQETRHFVVCHQPTEDKTSLLHTFSRAEIDADLICIIEQELSALGLLASAQDYNAVLFAVMASTFPSPRNQQLIWRHFCLTTLARLRVLVAQHAQPLPPPVSHIGPFAAIYQRVMDRLVGQSLLDETDEVCVNLRLAEGVHEDRLALGWLVTDEKMWRLLDLVGVREQTLCELMQPLLIGVSEHGHLPDAHSFLLPSVQAGRFSPTPFLLKLVQWHLLLSSAYEH